MLLRVFILAIRVLAIGGIVAAAVPLSAAAANGMAWDLLGVLIGAILVYLGSYTPEYLGAINQDRTHPHDGRLFNEFLGTLPPLSTSDFFTSFDFGNSFHQNQVTGLNRFVDYWESPDKEFRDAKLEMARMALHQKGKQLAMEIAMRTAPWPGDRAGVKPWNHSGPRTSSMQDDSRELNRLSKEFAKLYDAFVRLGRKRLTLHSTDTASKE